MPSVSAAGPGHPRDTVLLAPLLLLALLVAPLASAQVLRSGAVERSGDTGSLLPMTTSCSIVPEKELFIVDLSVVEDCLRTTWGSCPTPVPLPLPATQGAWTFGRLMQGLAGTADPVVLDRFVRDWLAHWQQNLLINGDSVPARPAIKTHVIDPWQLASGGTLLDMKKAPFRLLSIVARLDLRDLAAGSAGEGRFIFGLTDPQNPQQAKEMTVIFEYQLDARDCGALQNWAASWHALGSHPFGPQYNAALQAVTDRFTRIGASSRRLNGSAISQVRTNEILLAAPWELREFRLTPSGVIGSPGPAPLTEVTVARTPNTVHDKQQILADFINGNQAAILANQHDVPLSFQWQSFRAGHSPHNLQFGWDGPGGPCASIVDPEARHILSRETCSGCHGTPETNTRFYQVLPRAPGQVAQLAGFLTGAPGGGPIWVTDPCGRTHPFDDIERRRQDLCTLLGSSCATLSEEVPLQIVH
ncbi:MAG TPA: hypothetical protein VHQ65_01345 [Thermoanaerobaculia bacterium]|nr:hypothetical protein [Thermoanaerobaculia bacterium]